ATGSASSSAGDWRSGRLAASSSGTEPSSGGGKSMKQRLATALVLGFAALLGSAGVSHAHGERSQEGFLRMGTVAFYEVNFSGGDTLKQGEEMTVTGRVRVLDTWPNNLGTPETGFIGLTTPGPVVLLKDRTINGQPAPDAIFIKKGEDYDFKLTFAGRAT